VSRKRAARAVDSFHVNEAEAFTPGREHENCAANLACACRRGQCIFSIMKNRSSMVWRAYPGFRKKAAHWGGRHQCSPRKLYEVPSEWATSGALRHGAPNNRDPTPARSATPDAFWAVEHRQRARWFTPFTKVERALPSIGPNLSLRFDNGSSDAPPKRFLPQCLAF